MSIYKRGQIFMMDFVYKGIRVHKSTECTLKTDALRVEKMAKEQLRRDYVLEKVSPKTISYPTISEAAERQYQERWCRDSSGEQARNKLLHLSRVYGNVSLDRIDLYYVERIKNGLLNEGKSLATVNRYLSRLRTVMHSAKLRWGFEKLPIPLFNLQKERTGRRVVITREQEKELLNFFQTYPFSPRQTFYKHMPDLLCVLLDTGMRLSECLDGTFQINFLLEQRLIILYPDQTKSGEPRTIPMSKIVFKILLERSLSNSSKPFPLTRYQASDAFRYAKKALQFQDAGLCIHSTRHTFASRLLEQGEDIRTVQVLLGHAEITTTTRYAHLATPKLKSAIERL